MTFDEYQKQAHSTAVYPSKDKYYVMLGLCGEVGELANKLKKSIRDKNKFATSDAEFEIGDALWYLAELCTTYKISLDKVAKANIEKLRMRRKQGTIHGSGDNR